MNAVCCTASIVKNRFQSVCFHWRRSAISFDNSAGVRTLSAIASGGGSPLRNYRHKFENNCNISGRAILAKYRPMVIGGSAMRNLCSEEGGGGESRQVSSFNVQDYDDFKKRVLNSDKPVVVDFYADWCGPCKMLGPRLEMVVDNRAGKVMLAKVNVDDCGDVAMDYGVRSVPTVIAFKEGQPIDQFVGLQEEEQLDAFINKLAPQSE